jgi:hypothetical protein
MREILNYLAGTQIQAGGGKTFKKKSIFENRKLDFTYHHL